MEIVSKAMFLTSNMVMGEVGHTMSRRLKKIDEELIGATGECYEDNVFNVLSINWTIDDLVPTLVELERKRERFAWFDKRFAEGRRHGGRVAVRTAMKVCEM
jgi:hypothetical protein